ncbi:MAG: AgmX/PglI C-terminal domain-containing protein [Deltaproteobacteria bacterium]|nr:AgmX/PglI C-terminal domain-containing protein [Deltaproteobacteria bacterium]
MDTPPVSPRLVAWFAFVLLMSCRVSGPLSFGEPGPPSIDGAQLPPKARTPANTEPPPISLTASDGTGLTLVSVKADAVVEDPVALTQLELAFDNPYDRVVEGRFEVLLPPGAQVARFAMKIGGQWQEAELVEKQRARQTYESFLHEQRDPALLERDTGNRFRARVFPISPGEHKQLLVSYTQTLSDPQQPYRLSTRGLPRLEQLDLRVLVGEPGTSTYDVHQMHLRDQRPPADLVVERPASDTVGLRRGEHVVARFEPLAGVDAGEAKPLRHLTVLVDTSASRALDFDATLDGLQSLMTALSRQSPGTQIEVLAFDQGVVPVYDGALADFGPDAIATLRARRPLGASDIGGALAAIANGERERVLLVSDGLVSAGEDSNDGLRKRIAALASVGVTRLDALVVGGVRDDDRMRKLVTGALSEGGVVIDAAHDLERSARRLLQPTFGDLTIEVPGSTWSSPRTLEGAQPGDHVVLYAELPEGHSLNVKVSGPVEREHSIALSTTDSPLIGHMWMDAKVAGMITVLESIHDKNRSAVMRQQIIDLSVRHRIFNDFTAFLVLETEADYARFGLDRKGLSDILVVDDTGVRLQGRTTLAAVAPPVPEHPKPRVATGSIGGTVIHAARRTALEGALVILQCDCLSSPRETRTDADGRYAFGALPTGRYTVQPLVGQSDASKIVKLQKGQRITASFAIDPDDEVRLITTAPPGPRTRRAAPTHAPRRGATPIAAVNEFMEEDSSMEVFRNIPVGSSSGRDFTQVVDSSASASRDSMGIRLAGTTGAEAHYVVESVGMNTPSLSAVGGSPSTPRPPTVSFSGIKVSGAGLRRRNARHSLDAATTAVRACYNEALQGDGTLRGRVQVELHLDRSGHVTSIDRRKQRGLDDPELLRCVDSRLRALSFHVAGTEEATITLTVVFRRHDGPAAIVDDLGSTSDTTELLSATVADAEIPVGYVGLADIDRLLAANQGHRALAEAWAWRESSASDLLALIALGRAAEAGGHKALAARAYGSILDLYPSRADMRRFTAGQLEALSTDALALAIDAYRKALAERPDHPSSHRNLAFALLRAKQPREAFDVLAEGLLHGYPSGRFEATPQIFREDLGIAAAVWRNRHPDDNQQIRRRLRELGATMATRPSLRFVLTWETDANDVDLHVRDAKGNHAYYSEPRLRSGGNLYADVTNGFGPECFTIPGHATAYPYTLQVHYYSRGPMGFGLGKVQVLHHDGAGGIHLGDRPFVVLEDGATIDLGQVTRPPGRAVTKPGAKPSR